MLHLNEHTIFLIQGVYYLYLHWYIFYMVYILLVYIYTWYIFKLTNLIVHLDFAHIYI